MKPIVRLTCIAFSVMLFASCAKRDVVVPENPIAGSWILTQALEGDSYGWQSFATGLENGVFDFYSDGSAQYSEAHSSLSGTWYVSSSNGPYYDEYGSYFNGYHQTLDIHVSDYYTNSSIDLHFDNVRVSGNALIATYFNGNYIESYTFSRY